MNLKRLLLQGFAAATIIASAQQINPITQAVLNGYNDVLAETPNDYITLYQRGAQYYSLSMYDNALTDLQKAVQNTPAKDKDMLMQEYSLLSDVCCELKNYDKALVSVNNALEISPESYANLYRKGNILLYMNNPEEAYRVFATMQRLKSRSQEAFFGMAKASIMMGKSEDADKLIKEAEMADPSNYITYCRIGDLYQDLGDNGKAAANYLSAFGLADDSSRPIDSLIKLAEKDYPSVGSSLDYALTKTKNTIPLNFLKGNIAYRTGNYAAAYTAFNELLATPQARDESIYCAQARTALALNRLDDAYQAATNAVSLSKDSETLLVRSAVELARETPAAALLSATEAYKLDANSNEALIAVALANVALGDAKSAVEALNEVIMNDATNPYPLMLRAYINANSLNNDKSSVADYTRVIRIDDSSIAGTTYKALAQARTGKKLDADSTITKMLASNPDKEAYYYAAVYYAQTGDLEKGYSMAEKARDGGYQNIYNFITDKTPGLSLAPIRHLMN
jgi:predicted Zn-dependent protease